MPNYLKEADWKAVLKKPKNLGLKAQKTGISEKLRDLETAEKAFNNVEDLANAEVFAPLARVFSPNQELEPLLEELRTENARLGTELAESARKLSVAEGAQAQALGKENLFQGSELVARAAQGSSSGGGGKVVRADVLEKLRADGLAAVEDDCWRALEG